MLRAALVALAISISPSGGAADLRILSGNGARAAVTELAARFDRATGHKTSVEFAVNPETRTVLGRAGIGVGIRQGAPKPDISTVEAFKRTLLGAKAVAYPGEGASGKYFVSVVERLGIAEQMKPRMKPMPAEYNVEVVATGEADLVVVVASRISGVRGVQLLGGIPPELQTWIGFTAGASPQSREPQAVREMLRFFTSPDAAAILKSTGIEPFVE